MQKSTIVLGLDAAEPRLIEKWMAAGHLPNLRKIGQEGTYGRLDNTVNYCGIPTEYSTTEPLWATFATGCRADTLGYWDTVSYNPDNYEIVCDIVTSGYSYKEFPPFYALGENYVVLWQEPVTDVVDSSRLGRIGPLTHCRAGGHKSQGFLLAKGPDIPAGFELPKGETVDLAPTILNLMNAEIPEYLDGKALIKSMSRSAYSA